MAVVVVDYGAGNLKSAAKALMEAAKGTGIEVAVTADPAAVARADRIQAAMFGRLVRRALVPKSPS